MKKVINPEVLLIVGILLYAFLPPLIANSTLAGITGMASILILLLGGAGIAQRHKPTLIIYFASFCLLMLSFLLDRIVKNDSLPWHTIGIYAGYAVLLCVAISWLLSLFDRLKSQKNR